VSRPAQGTSRPADEGNVSDVLSQGEIDALLAAIAAGDVDATSLHERVDGPQVRPFDFSRPNKFAREQLRTLEMLHENFCRTASNQLSAQLRTVVEIEVVRADQVTYGEFVNSLPLPTLIEIVSVEPLEGNAILEISLPAVFSMVDRLVGGPGTSRPRLRELTEIEHALLRPVNDSLLNALSEAWGSVVPVRFRQVGAEMNPQFAQIVSPSDMAILIAFDLNAGGATGSISLCLPYLMLEPIVDRLSAKNYFSGVAERTPEARESVERELENVQVPISVELGSARLQVEDLIALAPGDVIPLSTTPGEDVRVRVGKREAFRAQPGTRGRRSAVQITERVEDPVEGALG
jgi:flagellar motor switch protein FliM